MELRKLYNQFREDKKWMQLGNRSLRKVEGCILKKHGNVEAKTLTREQANKWIEESGLPKDYTIPAASAVNYMMVWAGLWKDEKPVIVKPKLTEPKPIQPKVQPSVIVPKIEPKQDPKPEPKPKAQKPKRERHGSIYTEIHNHGRRSNGSSDGNRRSVRFVKGVGMQRCPGYRWVAEISYHNKRYRCRSYHYDVVWSWLMQMRDRFND